MNRAGIMDSAVPRMDAVELTGLTSIMNPQYIRPDVDLNQVEDDVIGKPQADVGSISAGVDPIQAYSAAINDLAIDLGLNDLDAEEYKGHVPPAEIPLDGSIAPSENIAPVGLDFKFPTSEISFSAHPEEDVDDSSDDNDSSDESEVIIHGPRSVKKSEVSGEENQSMSGREAEEHFEELKREFGLDLNHKPQPRPSTNHARKVTQKEMTEEQRRRDVINDVLGKSDTQHFDLSQERDHDTKTSKLERIEMLRLMLEDDGISCKSVGKLDINASMAEIDSALSILQMRNDHNRYSTIAEEIIQTAAQGIEAVLNGQNRIPILNIAPDYTGLSATMQVKMHRLRGETSAVVEDVVKSAGLGPKARLIFELFPTLVLYPINNARQKGKSSLRRSRSAIRKSDERDKLMNM